MRLVDGHHHLWDLQAIDYPWLQARGARRFFGDLNLKETMRSLAPHDEDWILRSCSVY